MGYLPASMGCCNLKVLVLCALALATLLTTRAKAFVHVVQKGDTLASVAERFYGRIQYERLLVAANFLEAQGGTPIVAGMRLEVPSVSFHRVKPGDTWAKMAEELLGSANRADVLAIANGSSPWLSPETGAEILVPYNLRVVVSESDTLTGLAYKFLGDKNKAWQMYRYNGLKGRGPRSGDVILIPLVDLPLTEAGKSAAAASLAAGCSEAGGDTRRAQRRIQSELQALIADVRSARYVDAVTRGSGFLASGALSQPQLALVHRQLLEAYTALDAPGLATASCTEWLKNDPDAKLDSARLSPKLIAACKRGGARP
ncbi:MAG TPA: LysM domain-containing protein [Polyangiaceae bacterium]